MIEISPEYLRHVVERLESFRSHPLGFRVAGTPEERAATAFVAAEMRKLGLTGVTEEPVPVDGWRLREAFVELADGTRFECASFGGVPETGRKGIKGDLVPVGRGGRKQLDRVDVRGKVALVEWQVARLWPYHVGLELGLRGAVAMVVYSPPGGPYYQAPGALGTFDGIWHAEGPPCVTATKEDGALLAARAGENVRVVLSAPLTRGAEAANVVGELPGRRARRSRRSSPATTTAGSEPRSTTRPGLRSRSSSPAPSPRRGSGRGARSPSSRTPRRSTGSPSRPTTGATAPGTRSSRSTASGRPARPSTSTSRARAAPSCSRSTFLPSSRAGFAGPAGKRAATASCPTAIASRRRTRGPRCGRSSRPGSRESTSPRSPAEFDRTEYHTQYDTTEKVDFDYLARLTEVCARLLLDEPELDFAARATDLRRSLNGKVPRELGPRARRAREGGGPEALHRRRPGAARPRRDRRPALSTRADGSRRRAASKRRWRISPNAAKPLARVGLNWLCSDLSHEAFRRERARRSRTAPRASWGGQGDADRGPDLWRELASLRGEPGARPPGPWLERSLRRHLERSRGELARRLDRMAEAAGGRVYPLRRPRPVDLPVQTRT